MTTKSSETVEKRSITVILQSRYDQKQMKHNTLQLRWFCVQRNVRHSDVYGSSGLAGINS